MFNKDVGPYKISKTLGKGRFSKVKLGKHVQTGELVAIKILDKEAMEAAGAEQEVMHEVQIMKHLKHPNVVNLREIIASRENIYLVMEYVPGGDLFDHILKNGAMGESEAKRLFYQLMEGVEFCHLNGVFHRDIKADNVLLTADGQVKLADFGLGALAPHHLGADGLLCTFAGTANCAAPEVLARKGGYAGGPADIWGLGVLLYFLTAQRAPFYGPEYSALKSRISRGDYHVPLSFSDQLTSFVKVILCVDPAKRATFSELKQHPWIKSEVDSKRWLDMHPEPSHEDPEKVLVAPRPMTMGECDSLEGALSMKCRAGGMNAFELMASALDISPIFDEQISGARTSTRFLSKQEPAVIVMGLEKAAKDRGGRLTQSSKSRCKLVAVQTRHGVTSAYVDIIEVVSGLLMIQFVKHSGSTAAFHALFYEISEEFEGSNSSASQDGSVAIT